MRSQSAGVAMEPQSVRRMCALMLPAVVSPSTLFQVGVAKKSFAVLSALPGTLMMLSGAGAAPICAQLSEMPAAQGDEYVDSFVVPQDAGFTAAWVKATTGFVGSAMGTAA